MHCYLRCKKDVFWGLCTEVHIYLRRAYDNLKYLIVPSPVRYILHMYGNRRLIWCLVGGNSSRFRRSLDQVQVRLVPRSLRLLHFNKVVNAEKTPTLVRPLILLFLIRSNLEGE